MLRSSEGNAERRNLPETLFLPTNYVFPTTLLVATFPPPSTLYRHCHPPHTLMSRSPQEPSSSPSVTCLRDTTAGLTWLSSSSKAVTAVAPCTHRLLREFACIFLDVSFILHTLRGAVMAQCLTGSATVRKEARNLKTDHHFARLYTLHGPIYKNTIYISRRPYIHTPRVLEH